mmetsp:Transcript_63898/g.175413  ORF Transcript_63898/g.175413 Transcript_63898/m.175413 type:complete len:246 (-) Transcript_63898:1351-2088(-)
MRRMSDCAIRRRASSAEPLLWILAFGATFTSAPISSWVSVPSVRIWTRTAPLSRGSCIATRSAWSAATYRGTDTKRCELRYLSCFATSPRRMCTTSRGLPSPRAPVCCLRPSPVGMTMAPSLELRRTKASHGDAMSDAAPAVGEAAGDVDDSAAVSRSFKTADQNRSRIHNPAYSSDWRLPAPGSWCASSSKPNCCRSHIKLDGFAFVRLAATAAALAGFGLGFARSGSSNVVRGRPLSLAMGLV